MIEVTNLHFTYPGNKEETLKGLDFSISPGEIFGFLGPSGAGKSTIQKIVIGILKDYKGWVQVDGVKIKDLGPDYYERIGVAFEFPNLYGKLTALENLAFFRSLYSGQTQDPKKLLALVGLEDVGRVQVSNFSKGMKMRLNFVRALLNDPRIIFLDEPTSGLDPMNARIVKEIILRQKEAGKTILVTTHNMTVADEICDRVAFIVNGQISALDSPRALKLASGKKRLKVEYLEDEWTKEVLFDLDNIGYCEQFWSLLREKNVETIHTLEPTLEDIFIELTGRNLL